MPVVNSDFPPQLSRLKGKKAWLLFPKKDKIKRKHHQSPELSKKKEPQWTFHFGVVAVEKLTCCQRYSLKPRERKNTLILSHDIQQSDFGFHWTEIWGSQLKSNLELPDDLTGKKQFSSVNPNEREFGKQFQLSSLFFVESPLKH